MEWDSPDIKMSGLGLKLKKMHVNVGTCLRRDAQVVEENFMRRGRQVGTTSPTALLHVWGDAKVNTDLTVSVK